MTEISRLLLFFEHKSSRRDTFSNVFYLEFILFLSIILSTFRRVAEIQASHYSGTGTIVFIKVNTNRDVLNALITRSLYLCYFLYLYVKTEESLFEETFGGREGVRE